MPAATGYPFLDTQGTDTAVAITDRLPHLVADSIELTGLIEPAPPTAGFALGFPLGVGSWDVGIGEYPVIRIAAIRLEAAR